jgi:DNA-binding response OmpR family regulator
VVLDWLLPGLDGLSVCRELRRKHLMPIIMLTARSEVADRVSGLQVGADDYIGKPFSIVELSARISSLLRRVALDSAASSPDATNPMTFGQLVLDPSGHRATLAGVPLDLSLREMELLELLLSHPGRTFSRDYLLQRLWGDDFDGLDRAVDTQMVRLRRKLGDLGVCIEAVWGVGYRFRHELLES